MPIMSEAASALRSRFGFQESSDPESVRSSSVLPKSASKENLFQSSATATTTAIRSINERDDHGVGNQSFELQEDPSFWKDHNVQVIIRIRPLNNSEISLQGYNKCIRQDSCQTITWTGHPESRFTFDVVADENVSQEKLFKVAGLPMVENCMEGYNSCMFAYGQTGSGKTHTMLGDIEGGTRRHSVNCGMTPRVFEYLFSRIQKEKEARREEKLRFTCKCSFLEIYNEQILDLLDPSSANLQIREDAKKGVYVENLTELEVSSARDVIQQLVQGATNRKVAATNMNRASSRSHSVFTCVIESKWESQGVTHHRFAQLNLVDLAGSERQKSSGAEGERLKEATNINKSLSTLGLVIMNLVSISNGKSHHVPYRDSKLTFLLQDSLGGNSKTIIIANISPSNCCSLETLSTLKFAQRAKFIKNNAMVNEDASGDVLTMRLQIQQLKKEVSRLRGLVDGGAENQENDNWTVCFPGSPVSFKWEGLQGSFSPLMSNKRLSQKKEYDVALVGAFRREKDKEIALQALAAESQAAMQLAKQREDEIQVLKMRLRFREAGIKRLEAVSSGKISAETHLLQEKEEHLKELEALRTQMDRNQEVTRFAMENLRLKEELRRLKPFCDDGEREMMNEQIMILQNKLLEALDWKLMHEADSSIIQKGISDLENISSGEENLLISGQDPTSPWRSSMNEENEFLRMQAIQNQREMDALHKKLNFCLEEKEKLERHVNSLVIELEEEKASSRAIKEEARQQLHVDLSLPSTTLDHRPNVALSDQMELKTMVDAIAAVSQREAEAQESAIILAKENEELRMKLKVLIEDNNKLIELYERAVAEAKDINNSKATSAQADNTEDQSNGFTLFPEEKELDRTNEIERLECQLQEMHEENEKLMGLYEKAMQERDELSAAAEAKDINNSKATIAQADNTDDQNNGFTFFSNEKGLDGLNKIEHLECQLQEMHEENEKLMGLYEKAVQERDELSAAAEAKDVNNSKATNAQAHNTEDQNNGFTFFSNEKELDRAKEIEHLDLQLKEMHEENEKLMGLYEKSMQERDEFKRIFSKISSLFGLVEKTNSEVDKLSREIETADNGIHEKQKEVAGLKYLSSEIQERRAIMDNKFLALKSSLSSFSLSVVYWEQREARARARVNASSSYVDRKKKELACLQAHKREIDAARGKVQQSDVEVRTKIIYLKSKLEEENRRQETEKVLFAIDNVDKTEVSAHRNWHLGGKATELLKMEEERTKLRAEMKQSREKMGFIQKEIEDLKRKSGKLEGDMKAVEGELQAGLRSLEEMELGLQNVTQEKEMLLEIMENARSEVEHMILEYQQCAFESDLKEEEMKILEEELQMEIRSLDELRAAKVVATKKTTKLLDDKVFSFMASDANNQSWDISEKMEDELQDVPTSVLEVKLLGDDR